MNPTSIRARVEKTLPRLALGLFASASLLALLSGTARSQTTTLPAVTVQGQAESDSLTTADETEARRNLEKIPGAVGFVSEAEIREGRSATVKDLLDYVPGVFAQPKYGQEDARLSVRGSGLSRNFHLRGMRLLLDGVPINQADGAGDFQEIDPLALRYIEVYKGANALQFGAAGLGGAVNYVSPTGRSNPGFLTRLEIGSFETLRTQLAAGQAEGAFDYYVTGSYGHAEGYRDHTDQDYARLNGNIGYRFGDGAETRFYLSANSINQKITGSLTRNAAFATPESTVEGNFGHNRNNTKRDINSLRVANKTTWLTEGGDFTLGVYYANKELFHPVIFSPFFGIVIENEENNYGAYARYTQSGLLFGNRNDLVLGAHYFGGVNRARTFNNVGGSRGALASDADQISANAEIYAENAHYVAPTLALVAGAQGSFSERNLEDKFLSDGDNSGSRNFYAVNPKLGLRWDAAPGIQVFGNLSLAKEAPPFSELDPASSGAGLFPLKAQKSTTLEIGTRGKNGDWGWDAALYRSWLRDEIQQVLIGAGDEARNLDKTIHQGLELGGDWVALRNAVAQGDSVTTRLAYTFSDFHFDNDATFRDNKIPGAPRHYLRAELRYASAAGWYVAPNVEWVPEAYHVDNANTTKTAAYALLGMKAGYDYGNGLKFFLDGRNLLDKTYISNVSVISTAANGSLLYNPGDGRAVYAGVEWRF